MPDKRKWFRHLSTVSFWALVLIVFAATVAIGIYEMTYLEASHNRLINYDSVALSVKQQIAALTGSQDSVVAKNKYPIITGDEYHPTEIHDSLFSFEIAYDSTKDGIGEWKNFVKSIAVFRFSDHKKIQAVVPTEKWQFTSSIIPIVVEDMNFDGYNDFRVMTFRMTRGQTFHDFWLFDPKNGKFEADTFLSNNMWDVEFNHKEKTVISNQRLAGGPFNQINEVYSWENRKLILQHKEECDQNPFGEDAILTMTRWSNGKLIERTKHFDTIPISKTGQVIYNWEKLK